LSLACPGNVHGLCHTLVVIDGPHVIVRISRLRQRFVVGDDINERKIVDKPKEERGVTPPTLASDAADSVGSEAVVEARRLDPGSAIVGPRRVDAGARVSSEALVAQDVLERGEAEEHVAA
jgi:hypothetical protein